MSVSFYKVAHIVGLLLTFISLTGTWGLFVSGNAAVIRRHRARLAAMHGLGLMALLISGFGMLAKLGYLAQLPAWSIVKVILWLILGGSVALAKRKTAWGQKLIWMWIVVGALAAYLCVYKPELI